MNSSKNFTEVLKELDDCEGILNIRFADGTPLWLNLRFMLRLQNMANEAGSSNSNSSVRGNTKIELVKSIFHSFYNHPFKIQNQIDLLSIANYEGNPECPNRMTIFLKELKEYKLAECLYSPALRRFPKLKHTYSFDYFYYQAWIKSKLTRSKNETQFSIDLDNLFEKLQKYFEGLFTLKQLNNLKSQLLFIDKLSGNYRKSISHWLMKKRPKLILCSEGNNGDWRHAILFNEANKLGIPTAEVQHGIFNIGMKYGTNLATNPDFAQHKSTYLFTFGKFHCSQTNLPSKCVPIGHYDLEKAVKKLCDKKETKSKKDKLKILFICEGIPPSAVDNGLIRNTEKVLSSLVIPFQLIVRLHPSESPDEKYSGLLNLPDSRYSSFKEDSIHALLADCDLVISHASTVVYEAFYFNKPVFVLEDANTGQYIPSGIGERFSNDEELLRLLMNPLKGDTNETRFWENGGVVNNFKKFYQQLRTTFV